MQLTLGILGIFLTMLCFIGLPLLVGSIIWAVIDAIMIFTGSVTDSYGRKLR